MYYNLTKTSAKYREALRPNIIPSWMFLLMYCCSIVYFEVQDPNFRIRPGSLLFSSKKLSYKVRSYTTINAVVVHATNDKMLK